MAVAGDSISAGSPLWDPDAAVRARIPAPDERSQWQWWASHADPRLEFRTTAVYGERTDQIAERVSERRVAMGLSQRELAELCGTTQSAIARLERGGRPPRIDTLLRIADALDCELVVELEPRK